MFIIASIITIAALVVLLAWRSSVKESKKNKYEDDSFRKPLGWATLVLFSVSSVFWIFSVFSRQDPGEAIVRLSFTKQIAGVTTSAGMHWKAPWDSTEVFNIRNQKIEMFSNDNGNGANGAVISSPLANGANADVSITVLYSIDPEAVREIYTDFKTQDGLLSSALEPSLRDIVRKESAKFEPLLIKQNRADLGGKIEAALDAWHDQYGIIVETVNLGDIKLDEETENSIEGASAAKQKNEQLRNELEGARINAEKTRTIALADADADQIIRCGATTTTTTQIIDGKETEVTDVIPKSGAECENRLSEQVLYARYIDALKEIAANGNLIVITPEGGNGPILNLPEATKQSTED
jgi:regulator of protease activity HflC (stomatin/prohibitin superfamily)